MNKLKDRCLLSLLFVLVVIALQPYAGLSLEAASQTSQNSVLQKPVSDFSRVAPLLRRESRVPLRLPSFLPDVDEKDPIYILVESANSTSYSLLLATAVPCEGQNVCLYGSVQGSTSPSAFYTDDDAKTVPITLEGGIKAEFIGTVCRAYCTEAFVRWREGRFYYSIGIKAEREKTLIKVANSAIAAGRKKNS